MYASCQPVDHGLACVRQRPVYPCGIWHTRPVSLVFTQTCCQACIGCQWHWVLRDCPCSPMAHGQGLLTLGALQQRVFIGAICAPCQHCWRSMQYSSSEDCKPSEIKRHNHDTVASCAASSTCTRASADARLASPSSRPHTSCAFPVSRCRVPKFCIQSLATSTSPQLRS